MCFKKETRLKNNGRIKLIYYKNSGMFLSQFTKRYNNNLDYCFGDNIFDNYTDITYTLYYPTNKYYLKRIVRLIRTKYPKYQFYYRRIVSTIYSNRKFLCENNEGDA